LIADITAHDSIHDMLGLDSLTPFPQLKAAFNKTLRIVDPNEDKDPGVEFGESHATQKLTEAYKVYKDLHDAEAANRRRVNQRPRTAVPPSSSSLSGGRGQAAAAGAPPAPQPLPHGPSQGLFAASENNIFRHCIIASDNNSFHTWDAGLQFLSYKEISGNLFELRNFTFTSALPIGKDRTIFLNCMRKVLVLADIFQDSICARDTLRQLARSLPTLLLSHGYKSIQARSNRFWNGDLEWLWATCTKAGRARQARLAANRRTGKARTATQLDARAQKLARAGNYSKSCQAICSDSSPALGSDTFRKLEAKNPQGSVLFDKRFWPTPADMDALRQEDDWQHVEEEHYVNYEVSNSLVSVQLDASHAFCSILRQPQFDVLAGKASRRYDNGRVEIGGELLKPHTLDKYWVYFESMWGNASIMRFSDNQGTTHPLPCSKGGQQGDSLETIRFAVTAHLSIGRVCERHLGCKVVGICDDIFIVDSLSDALSCAAELKQILKADFDIVLNVS